MGVKKGDKYEVLVKLLFDCFVSAAGIHRSSLSLCPVELSARKRRGQTVLDTHNTSGQPKALARSRKQACNSCAKLTLL